MSVFDQGGNRCHEEMRSSQAASGRCYLGARMTRDFGDLQAHRHAGRRS